MIARPLSRSLTINGDGSTSTVQHTKSFMKLITTCLFAFFLVGVVIAGRAWSAPPEATPPVETGSCNAFTECVRANGWRLNLHTYKSEHLTGSPVLIVALHGDAPFNNPSYHYRFAKLVSERSEDTVSVGLLRPGYTDADGRASDGERGLAVGDNYDADRVASIASAIKSLGAHYNARKVILAGHSGGAAITAKLLALHPGVVDHAFIVSCPCDINRWRADMFAASGFEGFKGDLDVQSPIDLAKDVPETSKVSILVGRHDANTTPALSRAYLDALKAAGKQAHLQVVEGGHEIFLSEDVVSAVSRAARD